MRKDRDFKYGPLKRRGVIEFRAFKTIDGEEREIFNEGELQALFMAWVYDYIEHISPKVESSGGQHTITGEKG